MSQYKSMNTEQITQKLNELKTQAYNTAKEKGFHDKEMPINHYLMLIITELSEAVEAHRKNHWANRALYEQCKDSNFIQAFQTHIKDSVEDEIADTCIRILDLAGLCNLPISYIVGDDEATYKEKEMAEAFKKEDFARLIFAFIREIVNNKQNIIFLVYGFIRLCHHNNINLLWHIEEKMKYNETRPSLHGKKY